LIYYWDVYDKEGAMQELNQHPLFLPNQVVLRHTDRPGEPRRLQVAIILDLVALNSNIKKAVEMNPTYKEYLGPTNTWEEDK